MLSLSTLLPDLIGALTPQPSPAPAANGRPTLRSGRLHLEKDQILRVPGAAGWSLRAQSGALWITRDGDLRDIILAPGDSFLFDRDGDALVSPLDDSDLCLAQDAAGQTACGAA